MYAVDDAVAKVDGSIISVANGGAHVGEKRLVRIEEAGRTSATAVLVGDQASGSTNGAASKKAEAKADAGESKPAPKRSRASRSKAAAKDDSGDAAAEAEEAASDGEEAGSDGDGVESTPRRRGRRGGRRRSAAKADATSD
jgi:ribonuclease G